MVNNADCCQNCRYGKHMPVKTVKFLGMSSVAPDYILCRRYPVTENKELDDWCGEYKGVYSE